jgi:2,4-dienoyl-CoA reductase-like NADH-dependent reductase (Old Yellow Enzyme family)
MTATDVLFRPFRIAGMELANRIVMAPMTRSFAMDGIPGAANAAYYRRRAQGGVGRILSEGTVIDRPASRNDPGVPFFHGDAALTGWKGVIDAVHDGGAKMGPQLWHTGALKSFLTEWVPDSPVESPSGVFCADRTGGVAPPRASLRFSPSYR